MNAVRLLPEAASAARARRFVESVLHTSGRPDLASIEDTAALLTSEVVTNAVLHAAGAIDVHVDLRDDVVRVSVSDEGRGLPVRKSDASEATTGRGLLLVERLAHRWGVDRHERGKTVWFEVHPA